MMTLLLLFALLKGASIASHRLPQPHNHQTLVAGIFADLALMTAWGVFGLACVGYLFGLADA